MKPDDNIERPLECSGCIRATKTIYTQINKEGISSIKTCSECPVLKKYLGYVSNKSPGEIQKENSIIAHLACPMCQTTLSSAMQGNSLGCKECYTIFGSQLIYNVISAQPNVLSSSLLFSTPIYFPRTDPDSLTTVATNNLRISRLKELLQTALSGEDYEQAAIIRDQINLLTESISHDTSQ